jgi:hypothetical protein
MNWRMQWNWQAEMSNAQDTTALGPSHLVGDVLVEPGDEEGVDGLGDGVLRKRESLR